MNMRKEAAFGMLFRHWLKKNPLETATFELKCTSTDSIPFSCIEDHQIDYGLAVDESDKGILIRVQGVSGEPDYVFLRHIPAYVVIRYPKSFHIIRILTFCHERDRSKRKSLTEDKAKEISYISVDI